MKINGGEMMVNSELGEGTEFIVKLPIKKIATEALEEIALTPVSYTHLDVYKRQI